MFKALLIGNGKKAEWVLGLKFSTGEFRVEQGSNQNIADDALQAAGALQKLVPWVTSMKEDAQVYCYEFSGTFRVNDNNIIFVDCINDLEDENLDQLTDDYRW